MLGISDEESVFLAEESLQDLLDLPVTAEILESGVEANSAIEIPDCGLALHLEEPGDAWLLLTDRYSKTKILSDHLAMWRGKNCRIVQREDGGFDRAIRNYFAQSLAGELFCDICPIVGPPLYVPDRIERLKAFLRPLISPDRSILEICCGSGMATQALLSLGAHPLCMDADRCEVCQALKSDLLETTASLVLDARLLPRFFSPKSFDLVVGFMVGLIDDFNWSLWKEIILKGSSLAEEMVLFTVYTEKEAELIAKALGEAGWKGEIIDNRDRRGIYDQWAYLGRREERRKGN
jgi:hypothetical protein